MSTTVDINNDELQVGGLEQLEEGTVFEETTLVVTQNNTDTPKQQPFSNLKLQLSAASAGDTEETAKVSLKTILQSLSNRIKALFARFDSETGHAHTGSDSARISYASLNNRPAIPTALSELLGDATHRTVTDTEKVFWGAKQTALVSGTNIKTINGVSVLGSGNLEVSGGGLSFKYLVFFDFYGSSDESLPAECAEGDVCFNRDTGKVFSATAENTWGSGEPVSDSIIYKYKGVAYHHFSGNDLIRLSNLSPETIILSDTSGSAISEVPSYSVNTKLFCQLNNTATNRAIKISAPTNDACCELTFENNTASAITITFPNASGIVNYPYSTSGIIISAGLRRTISWEMTGEASSTDMNIFWGDEQTAVS